MEYGQLDLSYVPIDRDEARRLIIELDSYSRAAAQLGTSRQRRHQLVGPGLTSQARAREATHCANCGRDLSQHRRQGEWCFCCFDWTKRHGIPWSQAAADARRRLQQPRCPRGYALTPDNVSISGPNRTCRQCQLEDYRRRRMERGLSMRPLTPPPAEPVRRIDGFTSKELHALIRAEGSYRTAANIAGVSVAKLKDAVGPDVLAAATGPR